MQLSIVVAAVSLNKYISQEARNDWLFKKYNNEDMIVIDYDDEDKEHEMLVGFMSSHLNNE